jgi:hypothetical protein
MIRSSGRGARRSTSVALLGATLLAACAGENLFSLAAFVGAAEPEVTITAPLDGFTVATGASVQVKAEVTAPDGLTTSTVSGVFKAGGAAAFVQLTDTYPSSPFASIDRTLAATPGAGTGDVWIIVSVTDAQGTTKADSASIIVS